MIMQFVKKKREKDTTKLAFGTTIHDDFTGGELKMLCIFMLFNETVAELDHAYAFLVLNPVLSCYPYCTTV